MKYYNTLPKEQETIINLDYYERTLTIYSSRKAVIKRLSLRFGKADKINYINKALTSACWIIPFSDKKRIHVALSRPLLIGQIT